MMRYVKALLLFVLVGTACYGLIGCATEEIILQTGFALIVHNSSQISLYDVDPIIGNLVQKAGSPVPVTWEGGGGEQGFPNIISIERDVNHLFLGERTFNQVQVLEISNATGELSRIGPIRKLASDGSTPFEPGGPARMLFSEGLLWVLSRGFDEATKGTDLYLYRFSATQGLSPAPGMPLQFPGFSPYLVKAAVASGLEFYLLWQDTGTLQINIEHFRIDDRTGAVLARRTIPVGAPAPDDLDDARMIRVGDQLFLYWAYVGFQLHPPTVALFDVDTTTGTPVQRGGNLAVAPDGQLDGQILNTGPWFYVSTNGGIFGFLVEPQQPVVAMPGLPFRPAGASRVVPGIVVNDFLCYVRFDGGGDATLEMAKVDEFGLISADSAGYTFPMGFNPGDLNQTGKFIIVGDIFSRDFVTLTSNNTTGDIIYLATYQGPLGSSVHFPFVSLTN